MQGPIVVLCKTCSVLLCVLEEPRIDLRAVLLLHIPDLILKLFVFTRFNRSSNNLGISYLLLNYLLIFTRFRYLQIIRELLVVREIILLKKCIILESNQKCAKNLIVLPTSILLYIINSELTTHIIYYTFIYIVILFVFDFVYFFIGIKALQ